MKNHASVTLVFAGDVMIGRLVNEVLLHKVPEYPWGDTLPLIRQADWRSCNLECVLSDRGSPWSLSPKTFHFRSNAANVATLEAARIDAVSLANNHTLDFGYEAMFDMLGLLDRAGIGRSGAGANLQEASRPAISQVNGLKIGLLAFTDNEPAWEATELRAGVFYVPVERGDERTARLLEVVREMRQRVDFIVVAAHWGSNWGYYPPPEHMALARTLIDAGADLIFGHSAHVYRGLEIYQGRPILYSAGDFIDDYAVDPTERNDRSCLFFVELEGGLPRRLKLFPTVIRHCQARLAKGSEAEEIAAEMTELCAAFDTPLLWNAAEHCAVLKAGCL